MKVTRTDYFTYITDGDTDITFRAKDQTWNCLFKGVRYEIHVAGPHVQPGYVGQHNAFAKKHLLTMAGGKAATGLSNFAATAEALRDGTRVNSSALKGFERAVTGKLSSVHTNRQHGDMHALYGDRQDKYDQLSPASQAQYQVHALGGLSQDDITPLTMVLCDLLSPDDLKEAFANAIAMELKRVPGALNNTVLRGHDNHGAPVLFGTDCVFQHDSRSNTFKRHSRMKVTIYLVSRTTNDVVAHIVHCHGT